MKTVAANRLTVLKTCLASLLCGFAWMGCQTAAPVADKGTQMPTRGTAFSEPIIIADGSVGLIWVAGEPGNSYRVFAATNSVIGGAEDVQTFDAGTNLAIRITLAAGRWFFSAKAFTETAQSDFSNEVFADVPTAPTLANSPTLVVQSSTNMQDWKQFFKLQIVP